MTSQQQLYWKIYRCITIKLNLARSLLHLCQDDQSLLKFYQEVVDFRYFFEDVKTYAAEIDGYTHEDLLEAVLQLVQFRDRTVKDLVTFQLVVQSSGTPKELYQLAVTRIKKAVEILEKQFFVWLENLESLILRLDNIYAIYNLTTRAKQLHWFHRHNLKNLINQQQKLNPNIAQDFLIDNSKKLQESVQQQAEKTLILVRMYTNSDQFTPDPVSQALKTLQESEEIPEPTTEDVKHLREILFSGANPPLEEQKIIVETEKTVRRRQLGSQLAEINQIEENMEQLRLAIEELNCETAKQLEQLQMVRQQLREGMFELLRLQQLIHAIDEEISLRTQAFQEAEDALNAQRRAVENDPNLSVAEKQAQLASLRAEEDQLRQRHTSVLMSLQSRKTELIKLAKAEAEKILAVKEQLTGKHLDEVTELEQQKLAASPSEARLLQVKIEKINAEFQEQMEIMEHFQQERVYEEDEYGRFYVNSDGRKVYQCASGASEYMLNDAGEWTKVREAMALLTDEKGDYYLDQFNRKVYVNRYFDSNGKRISRSADEYDQFSDESEDGQEFSYETQDDYRYIRRNIGKPLTQGLARLVLLQPHDPINYLANFLLQYQHNKDRLVARELELQELLVMRKQLPAEGHLCGLGAKTSSLK